MHQRNITGFDLYSCGQCVILFGFWKFSQPYVCFQQSLDVLKKSPKDFFTCDVVPTVFEAT